jgi:hypothetical protein
MQYFSYILSFFSVLSLWLMGNKSIYGMVIGLFSQVLWVIYVIWLGQYGLLIGVFAYTFVHIRNLIKWTKENKSSIVA